jgi:beta-1,4-mannosyltransferase
MYDIVLFLAPAFLLLVLSPILAVVAHLRYHRSRLARSSRLRPPAEQRLHHVGVVSLSPASHSPRALNHVTALAKSSKFTACLHAYAPCPALEHSTETAFIPVLAQGRKDAASFVRNVARQAVELYRSLVLNSSTRKYDLILINTPPCIPAFLVVLIAARFIHACPVVVDWHNFAFSIMRCNGSSNAIVAVARTYEWLLGRLMHGHFCVSRAMSDFLGHEWGIDAAVLYDRPPATFRRIDEIETRHELFVSLQRHACRDYCDRPNQTIATYRNEAGFAISRSSRPAIIVSSTSWTPDEDFGILLIALIALDKRLVDSTGVTGSVADGEFNSRVLCVITGRGPMRSAFERAVVAAEMKRVDVWFAWLPVEDYPRLLGCADLGVSLHTSSSELDLPMKVVDMLGCGLPVVAYRFNCIEELVKARKTGLLFRSGEELCEQLHMLLFQPSGSALRKQMSAHIVETFSSLAMRWQAGWEREALPLLVRLCERAR